MLRRRRRPEDLKGEESNMTPMIDVIFQLLIFFMLSMHFKEVEGKLLSQLPRTGIQDTPAPPMLEEVRVVLCAGGDTAAHLADKGAHEKRDKPADVCKALVERLEIGEVFKTETRAGKAAHNRTVYRALAARARELHAAIPHDPRKPPPVVIDADSEVPYEHVIGTVNACKEAGLETIEFVANPRLDRYYGSGQRGQFDRGR